MHFKGLFSVFIDIVTDSLGLLNKQMKVLYL